MKSLLIGLLWIYCSANAQMVTNRTCEAEGYFEIDDGTCRNFFTCISDGTNFISIDIKCSNQSLFDPSKGGCVPVGSFTCEQAVTTQAPCTRYGRFPIVEPTCQRYYLCYWSGGAFDRWDLKCPNSLVFNPTTEKCTLPTNYSCNN